MNTEPQLERKSTEPKPSAWLARAARSLERYQQLLSEADDTQWGEMRDRMERIVNKMFEDPELKKVFVTGMGWAEEGSFNSQQFIESIRPEVVESMDTYLQAEASKGEVELSPVLIGRIEDGRMELHMPPQPLDANPRAGYRLFLDGMKKAVEVAKENGVQTIEMTSWLLGQTEQAKFKGLGVVTEDGIPDGVREEAQLGAALYNAKQFETYMNTGELPKVKRMEFTPDQLQQYLHSIHA